MDRNRPGLACSAICTTVALRKESVDRNRRHEDGSLRLDTVALRKESVDRNANAPPEEHQTNSSLSARRAWIENTMRRDFKALGLRRSPQGERG